LDDLTAQRVAKIDQLRDAGIDPFPARTGRTATAAEVRATVDALLEGGDASSVDEVTVAGRVVAQRGMGKATFMDIRDGSGTIQALLRTNALGEESYDRLKLADLGDFVEVTGEPIRTRTGEPTVAATSWRMLTKAIHAPPEKFHGLADTEQRQRRRYLDLMANATTREVFETRSRIVSAIRRFLDDRGFLEVETPILQESAGGAAARPFTTFYNSLDEERALRISLELHLKRLVVGGFENVYEIGRIFRNEGMSTRHNPEFTMLELYQAYADYADIAALVEEMISSVAEQVIGTTKVEFRGRTIDFTPPWDRVKLLDALREHGDLELEEFSTEASLRRELDRRDLAPPPEAGFGKLVDHATSHYVEPRLIQPTFLLDYPVELSPLAKRKPDNPSLVERFEPFVAGFEIGNAYSELNDPIDQRERFAEQLRLQAAGDDEAELLDEDFLFALEHGMPPTGGLGLGIDRLVMLLTGQTTIREVILFPQHRTLKP
jgi:lysyl-tRNA synthetase, class II